MDLLKLATWAESVGPRYLYDIGTVHNEGTKHSYFYNRMTAGGKYSGTEKFFRHGSRIKDRIQFKAQTQLRRIEPLDEEANYTRVNPGKDISAPYSVGYASIVFNEFEMDLSASQARPEALAHIFKDVWTQKWTDFWTGVYNDLDSECFAVPDKTVMEVTSSTSMAPYSLPVFINEFLNGLPAGTDQPGGDWTTVEQLVPAGTGDTASMVANKSDWDCQKYGYDLSTDPQTKVTASAFFAGFQKLHTRCTKARLPKKPEYSMPATTPNVIFCSLWGKSTMEHLMRLSEDHFRGMGVTQDPAYPTPMFYNMPFEYISELDTAPLYPTLNAAGEGNLGNERASDGTINSTLGGTTTDSDGVTDVVIGHVGPRYYMTQMEGLHWTWHSDHYLQERGGWTTDRARPWELSKVITALNNLYCTSRAKQGIYFPKLAATGVLGL